MAHRGLLALLGSLFCCFAIHCNSSSPTLQAGPPDNQVQGQTEGPPCDSLGNFRNADFFPTKIYTDGVADSGILYVSTGSGIDSLDLNSGSKIWSSTYGFEPMLAAGGCLIAQTSFSTQPNDLVLVVIDVDDGKAIMTSPPLSAHAVRCASNPALAHRATAFRHVRGGQGEELY